MQTCRICDSQDLEYFKGSNITELNSDTFAITNSDYGVTGELYRCKSCGFIQCESLKDVLPFYETLSDDKYEATRKERALQAERLLDVIGQYKIGGRLLDVGAGSGILVEQALNRGYDAEGIEPSRWFYSRAKERNLPIVLGVLPHKNISAGYDIITLIDVIEHVENPLELLYNIHALISKDGIVIAVTPDINSFFARVLKWRWWHFRVAHIGYFNRKSLKYAFKRAGFQVLSIRRPTWYFSADYIISRINTYLPRYLRLPVYSFSKKIVFPLNLRDSILGVFKPSEQ